MTVDKISVSLDAEVAELVREAATKEGVSLSAWITNAAQDRLRNLLLGVALDKIFEEIGPLGEEEMEQLVAESRAKSIMTEPAKRHAS